MPLFSYLQNGGNGPYIMEFWELKASPLINVEMTDTIINNDNEMGEFPLQS